MKLLPHALIAGALTFLPSCSDLLPVNKSGASYKQGVADGRAQEVRNNYWRQQAAEAVPEIKKRFVPITVPEQTTTDGIIVEQHEELVEISQ